MSSKSCELFGIMPQRAGQDLDRNLTIDFRITSAMDLAYPVFTDGHDDLIRGEFVAGR